MTYTEIDVTNCDKEPIQFLGRIQSHGFLVGVSKKSGKISHASVNSLSFAGLEIKKILGKSPAVFNSIIKPTGNITFQQLYEDMVKNDKSVNDLSDTIEVTIGGKKNYFSLVDAGDTFLLEFEPLISAENLTNSLFNMVSRLAAAKNLPELYDKAAKELKSLTGYERVMVYQFLDDGSGEVVGEAIDKHIESFLGQRYPESDIPKQARELYTKNHMRLIADVAEPTIEITGVKSAQIPDLTDSALRAVSPTHILYLKNMGVATSFSVSIIIDEKLWGLMSFHSCTAPRFIDLRIRQAAKLLTGIVASQIASKNTEIRKSRSERFQNSILRIQNYLTLDDSVDTALIKHSINILDINDSSGAALMFKGNLTLMGEAPSQSAVEKLCDWASENVDDLFHTDKLTELYAPAEKFFKKGSGILVSILNEETKDLIIWFKPEKVYSIQWAGEPVKKVEVDPAGDTVGSRIVPRTSFKVIKQVVKKTSDPWLPEEVDAAIKITKYVKDQILKTTQKQLEFNEKLGEAYSELDSFTYTVSHDLKTPLTVIRTYAQFLNHSLPDMDEKSKGVVKNILSGTDKLSFMLARLLELSKISRQEFALEPVNVKKIVDNILKEQSLISDLSKVKLKIGSTPDLMGNEILLYHVFSNIINNAIKYSSKQEKPAIEIKGLRDGVNVVYEIKDNGVGMEESQQANAFKLFKRLDNAREFEGTGAGLAIAKKVMEKHGGQISYKSKPGAGTTFFLIFQNEVKQTK